MSPRSRRRLLLSLAVAGVTGASALSLALWHYTRPEVQRELLLDALRGAGWTGDVATVSAGLTGDFLVESANLTDPAGRRYSLARAEGRVALWDTLTGAPHVERLTAEGLVADLSPGRETGPKAPGRASSGRHRSFRVDAADISGKVSGGPGGGLRFELRARDVDTESGGVVVFRAASESGPVFTGEARARFSGGLVASDDPLAVWASLNPVLTVEAEARPAAESPVAVALTLTADSDSAVLEARSGAGRADVRATVSPAGALKAEGRLALDRTSLAPWMKEATPPGFSARGDFHLTYDRAARAVDASARFSGEVDAPKVGPAGLRAFSVEADVSGAPGGAWHVRRLHGAAGSPAEPRALLLEAGALTLHPGAAFIVETSPGRAVNLRLARAPLAWLNPFLRGSGWAFASGAASGELSLSRDAEGRFTLESGSGLNCGPAVVLRDGRVWLDDLSLSLPLKMERAPDGALSLSLSKAGLVRGGETVAGADLEWKGDRTGAGLLTAKALVAPGALPADFLPGEACRFCRESGLRFPGEVRVRADGRGAFRVESARVEGVTSAGVRAFAATLLRPVSSAGIAPDARPLAAFEFKGAPLSLFKSLPGLAAVPGGVAETGDLHVSRTRSGWKVFRPEGGAAAFVRGFSWTDAAGVVRVAPTDARASILWEQTPAGWRLNLGELSFDNPAGHALGGRFALDWAAGEPASVSADLAGDLPALEASVPATRALRAQGGAYALKANHAAASASSLAEVSLTRLRFEGSSELGLAMSARLTRDGDAARFSLQPVLKGPSGTTHLSLEGSLLRRGSGRVWDATLAGGVFHADDWAPLWASPSVRADGAAGAPSAMPEKADAAPFWAGHEGRLAVSLEAVRVAGQSVTHPRANLRLDKGRLAAESVSAEFQGFPAQGDAALEFRTGEPRPYVLTAKAGARTVAMGRVIGAVSPKAAGWIDGDFDLDFAASGDGATTADLSHRLTFSARAESRSGTLRFFRVDNEAVRLSGELAGVAGDLAGDLGRILGKTAPGVGRLLDGAAVIRRALDLVRYRRLELAVTRLPDGSFEVPKAELEDEVLRLFASGKIGPAEGPSFSDRHALVSARLDGRNAIAEALRALGGSSGGTDAAGWLTGPELRYDGPLNNLRSNLLNNLFRAVSAPALPIPAPVRRAPDRAVKALERVLDGI